MRHDSRLLPPARGLDRELLAQGQKIETGDFPYLYDSPLYAAYGGQAQVRAGCGVT